MKRQRGEVRFDAMACGRDVAVVVDYRWHRGVDSSEPDVMWDIDGVELTDEDGEPVDYATASADERRWIATTADCCILEAAS